MPKKMFPVLGIGLLVLLAWSLERDALRTTYSGRLEFILTKADYQAFKEYFFTHTQPGDIILTTMGGYWYLSLDNDMGLNPEKFTNLSNKLFGGKLQGRELYFSENGIHVYNNRRILANFLREITQYLNEHNTLKMRRVWGLSIASPICYLARMPSPYFFPPRKGSRTAQEQYIHNLSWRYLSHYRPEKYVFFGDAAHSRVSFVFYQIDPAFLIEHFGEVAGE